MTRVAAVDLGTNSTRLLVADVDGEQLEEISRRLTITRLGEGVDGRRRLLPVPIARVRNCLTEYRRELEALGAERTLAIATSAVRDAENGEAFLGEIEWSYGFTTRLLAGDEEAAMMIRGVTAGRPRSTTLSSSTSGADRRSSCSRRQGRSPSRRASTSAACGSRSASSAPIRRRGRSSPRRARTSARSCPRSRRRARSASRGRSRRSRRSTSAMPTTTRSHPRPPSPARVRRGATRAARGNADRGARARARHRAGRAPVIVAGIVVLREVLRAYGLAEIEVSRARRPRRAPRSRRPSCPSRKRARRLPAPTPAAEARRAAARARVLVLGEPRAGGRYGRARR